MNDKRLFAETLTGIAEIYGKEVSKAGMRIWWSALERFSDSQVQKALTDHATDPERGQFMPKPGDIVRRIEGTPEDAAMAAWAKVDHATRRVGTGPAWVFDDPKIHRALLAIGGLSVLGNATETDWPHLCREFCKRYSSPMNEGAYEPKLMGWHSDGKPVFIGNHERCRQVLAGGSDSRPMLTSIQDSAKAMLVDMTEGSA